ncbi:unnamed protein product [Callosobruchus maculatus]|uniref:Uncharacterized protein n=1 Tax=Callosobruchus maculatus TaxID=64391 RepID=A0A653DLY9_CALMS|nr:unnamed protein product [Callosobruchus maculatus]
MFASTFNFFVKGGSIQGLGIDYQEAFEEPTCVLIRVKIHLRRSNNQKTRNPVLLHAHQKILI